jgi:predicted ATPase
MTQSPYNSQICRLAAGMPLGIELAAAWVPSLPVATIAVVRSRHLEAIALYQHVIDTACPKAR